MENPKESTPLKEEEAPKDPETPKPAEPDLMEAIPFANWLATGKSWGTSLVQTAKDKTLSTIELVKKDLDEFSDTVSKEATAIASATTDAVKSQAQLFQQFVTTPDGEDEDDLRTEEEKKEFADLETKPAAASSNIPNSSSFGMGWMKSLVDTVQKFAVEDTTKDEHLYTEKIQYGPIRQAILDQYELSQIQNNERTFLSSPSEKVVKIYDEWLKDFKIAEYNGEINTLLGNNPRLRELYAKVVPADIDNHTFWSRYFFKVYTAEQEKLEKQKQLEINVSNSKEGKKDEKKVTPEGSEHSNEKDETWSMCSSTHDQLNEIPDEVSDVEQQPGPITPRATEDAHDGWENYDAPTGEAPSSHEKSTSDA